MKRALLTIWRILTLPCDESTRLMSASLDQELPWSERVAFRLHAIGCGSCRRFFRQIRFLRAAAEKSRGGPNDAAGNASLTLSPEARQRIEQAMREAIEASNEN